MFCDDAKDDLVSSSSLALSSRFSPRRYEVLNLKIVARRRSTGFELTKDLPLRVGDLIAGRYQVRKQRLLVAWFSGDSGDVCVYVCGWVVERVEVLHDPAVFVHKPLTTTTLR